MTDCMIYLILSIANEGQALGPLWLNYLERGVEGSSETISSSAKSDGENSCTPL